MDEDEYMRALCVLQPPRGPAAVAEQIRDVALWYDISEAEAARRLGRALTEPIREAIAKAGP